MYKTVGACLYIHVHNIWCVFIYTYVYNKYITDICVYTYIHTRIQLDGACVYMP